MATVARLKALILGRARDPLRADTRHHMALVAFLAWVGLGADGLSSACYGPEEAFRALGDHTHLAPYLALAMAVTVFVIALAYNQVIELFPSGGGGYKVATHLLGARAGLLSGAALLVDYALTIAISVASGADAVFSLLPVGALGFKLLTAAALVCLLTVLNLRGIKESITVLLPIFLGFFVSHAYLIAQGIHAHREAIPRLFDAMVAETHSISLEHGWLFIAAILLRAYSLGGGTYTGLEAVSNNVNMLAEPRVSTGRYTMLYMALSLSFTAGGIILLYLLWEARPVPGQTLNAVVFASIIESWAIPEPWVREALLIGVLACEAGLLLVAANTGFLGGPAVLANMAADSWVPHQFRSLSVRLVTQNGVLLMGLAALAILVGTDGDVGVLVVLYSINVFLTFTLSLAGLVKHWWMYRRDERHWGRRLLLALTGLLVTSSILVVTFVEKFADGGWLTMLITAVVVIVCVFVRRHYLEVAVELEGVERLLAPAQVEDPDETKTVPRPRPAGTDGGVPGRSQPRGRDAHLTLGPAHVPGVLQELRVSLRGRGRCPEFLWAGGAAVAPLPDREHAALLHRLLSSPRARGDRPQCLRGRSQRRAGAAGRGGDGRVSAQPVLRGEARVRARELAHARPPQPDGLVGPTPAEPPRPVDGDHPAQALKTAKTAATERLAPPG